MTTLVFDLDDTLVPSTASYRVGLEAIGVDPDGQPFANARAKVKQRLGDIPAARSRFLYFKQLLEDEDRFSPTSLLHLFETYERAMLAFLASSWSSLNRASLLGNLKKSHRLVMLTNESTRTQMLKLRAFGANDLFDRVVTSEEMGCEKPDPRMFAALGIDFSTSVMIGDDPNHDVLAARRHGMRAFLTHEFRQAPAPDGVRVLARLDDLPGVL